MNRPPAPPIPATAPATMPTAGQVVEAPLTPSRSPGPDQLTRRVEHVMGFPVSLAIRGRHADDPRGRRAWSEVMAWLHEVDRTFSTSRADSWIRRLGRDGVDLDQCPADVATVLDLAEQARRGSFGAFDVRRRAADGTPFLGSRG